MLRCQLSALGYMRTLPAPTRPQFHSTGLRTCVGDKRPNNGSRLPGMRAHTIKGQSNYVSGKSTSLPPHSRNSSHTMLQRSAAAANMRAALWRLHKGVNSICALCPARCSTILWPLVCPHLRTHAHTHAHAHAHCVHGDGTKQSARDTVRPLRAIIGGVNGEQQQQRWRRVHSFPPPTPSPIAHSNVYNTDEGWRVSRAVAL